MAKDRRSPPRTYTFEEKVSLIRRIDQLVRGDGSKLRDAAAAVGISDTSYKNWVRAGIRPAPPKPAPRPFTADERVALIAEVERRRVADGVTVEAACKAMGISDKSYYTWKRDAAPPPAMRPVEVTALVPVSPTATALATAGPGALVEITTTAASPPPTAGALALVAPGGYRVEGLAVETAAALLRALA